MSTDPNTEHRIRVKVFVDFWNFQLSVNSPGLAVQDRLAGFGAGGGTRILANS